jgi:cell division protein FtsW
LKRESIIVLYAVLALTSIGILMVFSAGAMEDGSASGFGLLGYASKQAVFAVIGLLCMSLAVRFDYHYLRSPIVYRAVALAAFALLVLVLIPGIGVERNFARRWIIVAGMSIQPSEFAKGALILLLAAKLCENRDHIKSFFKGYLPPLMLTVLIAGLVVLENDLGTPVVLCTVGIIIAFAAGTRLWHILLSMAPLAGAVAYLIVTSPVRVKRVMIFLNPWSDPSDSGLNLIQSMMGFARGGLTGQGAGAGEQKLHYLFGAHTDFIFAVWAEETGLVGTLCLVALFAVFLFAAMRIAANAPDLFGSLLATGIVTLITLQATINMAVAVGLVPTKGLALPFISAGGSSLIVNLALVGILLNIGLQAVEPEPKPKARLAPSS